MESHLLGFGPLVLGQDLGSDRALHRTAESVDAVVGLLRRKALEGLEDLLVLLEDQVIGSVSMQKIPRSAIVLDSSSSPYPFASQHRLRSVVDSIGGRIGLGRQKRT